MFLKRHDFVISLFGWIESYGQVINIVFSCSSVS